MLNFVFLLLICLVNLQPSSGQEDRRNAVISAMEKAVTFLAENHDNINIDGLLGFTVMEEGFSFSLVYGVFRTGKEAYLKTIEESQDSEKLTIERGRILAMREKMSTFREEAAQNIARQDPASYKDFAPVLKPEFWKVPQKWKKIKESVPYSLTSGNCLDLTTSDFCISALLGTRDDPNVCRIPDNCTNLMSNTHCGGYSLSHQLFYFLFARMKLCPNSLFQNAGDYENLFCDLMMQTNRNLENRNLIQELADLFTENIMFCGLAGFSDFFKNSWLDHILSWQRKDKGCFWMYTSSNDGRPVRRRTKRSEKIIEGGCSSHNTAVAVGALGGFLHYL